MWRCVDLALTDVSEELIASIFSLQPPADLGSPLEDSSTLKMEAILSSVTHDLHSATSQKTTFFEHSSSKNEGSLIKMCLKKHNCQFLENDSNSYDYIAVICGDCLA
jgi:hypothetical protein